MSRDSNGNMTLASGNPVVAYTTASSTVQNNTLADIRDEITDSLSRSGKGGMLSPFRNMDGTVSAPGVTFTDETSSGTRRAATNDVRHVIAGVDVLGLLKSGSNYIVQLFRGILKLIDPTGGKAVTISPPSGLAADYSLTLPTALPGSTLPVTLTSAGVLATGQIATAQITDLNVTRAKLVAVGQQISSSCGSYSTTSASPVDVTNLSVALTTTGRPVVVQVIADGATDGSNMGIYNGGSEASCQVAFELMRDATLIARVTIKAYILSTQYFLTLPALATLDVPSAGTYTYKVRGFKTVGTLYLQYCKLVAYEL